MPLIVKQLCSLWSRRSSATSEFKIEQLDNHLLDKVLIELRGVQALLKEGSQYFLKLAIDTWAMFTNA